jgi:hypothetical protein
MRKGEDPDPYLWLMDPDSVPAGPKTSGSPTASNESLRKVKYIFYSLNLVGDGEPQDPHLHGIRPAIQLLCGRGHGPPRETSPPGRVVEPEP